MERKSTLPGSFSMILLTFILSITLFACSSPKENNFQETKETTIQKDTGDVEDVAESSEPQTKEISIVDLDFNSTSDEVEKKMGKPSRIDTASGVSVYYYGDDQYSGNSVYFIEDKVCAFIIGEEDLAAPNGIKVGDSVVKALREYYIPEELAGLDITKEDTDREMLQKIIDRKKCVVFFNDYRNCRIKVSFGLPHGRIDGISIIKSNANHGSAQIVPSDFSAGTKEIAEKFGYPDLILIFTNYAFEFNYTDTSSKIMFLKDSSGSENSFSYQGKWLMPYEIKVGDTIHHVFKTLYIPNDIKNLDISLSMNNSEIADILKENHESYFRFDLLPDYGIAIGINESGTVHNANIRRFSDPQYPIISVGSTFEVPAFDKGTIATVADLYLSGCRIGSTRQDVFQMLGSPRKTEAGYDEYTDKYQDCYFENGVVYFLSVDDYKDLKTGRAWYYHITDPLVIGPRGLRVGDNIEKVMEVFPGRDDIDFKTITSYTPLYSNPNDPNEETNSASIHPATYKVYSGNVHINVDWVYGITFEYEDGIITGITLGEMLD